MQQPNQMRWETEGFLFTQRGPFQSLNPNRGITNRPFIPLPPPFVPQGKNMSQASFKGPITDYDKLEKIGEGMFWSFVLVPTIVCILYAPRYLWCCLQGYPQANQYVGCAQKDSFGE